MAFDVFDTQENMYYNVDDDDFEVSNQDPDDDDDEEEGDLSIWLEPAILVADDSDDYY